MDGIVFCLEIIGTVAFAFSGAMVGIRKKFDLFGILMMGIITSVGGGLLRDVIAGDRPYIFTKHVYAIAAFVGASVAVGVYELTGKEWATAIGFIVIIAIRYVAVKYHLNFPTIEDKKE